MIQLLIPYLIIDYFKIILIVYNVKDPKLIQFNQSFSFFIFFIYKKTSPINFNIKPLNF